VNKKYKTIAHIYNNNLLQITKPYIRRANVPNVHREKICELADLSKSQNLGGSLYCTTTYMFSHVFGTEGFTSVKQSKGSV
jgi:hypothetical protein